MDEMMNTLMKFFIEKKLISEKSKSGFDEQMSLLDAGIIDSINILELIAFIEEQFGVMIPDEDLRPEYFENFEAIKNLIKSKDPHMTTMPNNQADER